MSSMPFVRVSGTHREVGRQVGAATAEIVRRFAATPFDAALVEQYRAVTEAYLPWVVDELEGVAQGAGVDAAAVFAASIAELDSGCTDLVVLPDRTADGHLLVAHNNDFLADSERGYVAIEWRVPGDPVCFTLCLGPWLTAGWNDAGLSVTVTNMEPADACVGIPRVLQLRDVVRQRTLGDAVEAALHPARASSYNWVLAQRDGIAANVEAGARRAEITHLTNGVFAHTNHYTHRALLTLEREGPGLTGSKARLRRALQELARGEPWTAESLRLLLADHDGAPDSLCRHGDGYSVQTVYWCVVDVTAGSVVYGSGQPCRPDVVSYRLPFRGSGGRAGTRSAPR